MKAAALFLACVPIDASELALRVTVAVEEVEFGAPFPLTVERAWGAELEPQPWNDASLAPLVVTLLEVSSHTTADGHEERRLYRAQAFQREELVVPAAELRARPRTGGEELVAHSQALRLRVRSSLDGAEPGPAELPPGPLPERMRPRPLAAGLVALLTAVALAVWNWRRWSRASGPAAARSTPQGAALARIERLAGLEPAQLSLELGLILRTFVEQRHGLPASRRTSEELLEDLQRARDVSASQISALAAILASCDRAKFSGHAPSAAEAARLHEEARAFVRDSGPSASSQREAAA